MTMQIYRGEARKADELRVSVPDIYDELLLEKIRIETRCKIIPEQKSITEIRELLRADAAQNPDKLFEEIRQEDKSRYDSEPIINLVETLLEEALLQKATDIHLEPFPENFRIRFRKDGLLQDYKTLPCWIAEPVIIRLKLLAQVDITERRLPHDGSFSFQGIRNQANIRLSTLPVQNGEKCVLRLLPSNDKELTLEDLNFSPKILQALRIAFAAPQGILLVTGPTGSGKTTTLYAGLREIIGKKINVTTIEDPVEYELNGANQVQINEKCGFTFAKALRSILRQDPDVILVGEIRDEETAQIALRAAQTGHLVLSTLHTNSAKAAASRLEDLGIPRKLLQESLLGIIAQRLVRKLDKGNQYAGRTAILEFLRPDGTFVDGNIFENADKLTKQEITDQAEISRVLGNSL